MPDQTWRKFPLGRRWLYVAMACMTFRFIVSVEHFFNALASTAPISFMGNKAWYEELNDAVREAVFVIVCILYDFRRLRFDRDSDGTRNFGDEPWHERRRELRLALFTFAVALIIGLPLALIKECRLLSKTTWNETFWSDFPTDDALGAAVGVAMITYDQRRGRGEKNRTGIYCAACGYDLRATPERCPECGTVRGSSTR